MSQPGIFALGTRYHLHLEFDVTDAEALIEHVTEMRAGLGTVQGVNVVTGFAPGLWSRLRPGTGPADAADFEAMGSSGHRYPATQHDLWVWLHTGAVDGLHDAARHVVAQLEPVADLITGQQGFVHGASQDLTGFEDGTENPALDEAAELLGDAPIVLIQRWVHDLAAYSKMSTAEAEDMIGRTLHGSVELDDPPPSAHIERVVLEDDDGDELEIFRRSVSYGDTREEGLMFVGFSPDRARLHRMLERMLGADDGVTDALNQISAAVTGAYYVVPSPALLA